MKSLCLMGTYFLFGRKVLEMDDMVTQQCEDKGAETQRSKAVWTRTTHRNSGDAERDLESIPAIPIGGKCSLIE
ncbi:hypothetical protein AAY473_013822 [Plecturocebus cupreus]